MKPTDTCAGCRFWRRVVKRGRVTSHFECWRYPQIVRRHPDDWCGEYVFSGRAALKDTHHD